MIDRRGDQGRDRKALAKTKDHGAAAGVVVGAGVGPAQVSAEVVEMPADDKDLAAQGRVRAGQESDGVEALGPIRSGGIRRRCGAGCER